MPSRTLLTQAKGHQAHRHRFGSQIDQRPFSDCGLAMSERIGQVQLATRAVGLGQPQAQGASQWQEKISLLLVDLPQDLQF